MSTNSKTKQTLKPILRTAYLLFTLLLLAGALFYQPVEYDNTCSRFFLVHAIVARGTFNIDPYHESTIDKSLYAGHYYSNKAIGLSLLAAPVYWGLHQFPLVQVGGPLYPPAIYIVKLITTTLPFAFLGALMFYMACSWGADPRKAFLMVLAYGLGSIAWIHATMFSGHQLTGCLLFFSFALASILKSDSPALKMVLYSIAAGFLAGYAVLTDYMAVVGVGLIAIYMLTRPVSWTLKSGFIFGGLICVAILAWYNVICFGSPFSLSYQHLTFDKFKDGVDAGFLGVGIPRLGVLAATLASPARGLFFISPVLLLSLYGFVEVFRDGRRKPETVLMAAIFVGYLLFNAGWFGWHGGWTFGPRYLVPMLPFLAFPMAFGSWKTRIYVPLFIVSVFQVGAGVTGMPHVPEQILNPLPEFIFPCMGYSYTAGNPAQALGVSPMVSIWMCLVILGLLGYLVFRALPEHTIAEATVVKRLGIDSIGLYLWLVVVLVALAWTKTPDTRMVHYCRWRVLKDASMTTGHEDLREPTVREGIAAGVYK